MTSAPHPAPHRRVLAEGRYLRMIDDGGWEMVERIGVHGIVVLVALTTERRIVFVEQYRRPLQTRVIELPAGLAGDVPEAANEHLLEAAQRELLEETGHASSHWQLLTAGPISPGLSDERVTFYLARDTERIGPGGGVDDEDIEVHEVPLDEADAWLERQRDAGRLVDPKVYAGLYFAQRATPPARALAIPNASQSS